MNILKPIYRLIETKEASEQLGSYTSFGMEAACGEEVIRRQTDISLNREAVESLVSKCNRGELSVVHFYDVIEDFLAEGF